MCALCLVSYLQTIANSQVNVKYKFYTRAIDNTTFAVSGKMGPVKP